MGVRGLHTFITQVVRCGSRTVDMEEQAREYHRLKGQKPIIVIDLKPFHHAVYEGNHEKLLGGRFQKYNERLHNMLTTLSTLGFEMVFFIGDRRQKCNGSSVNRRDEKYWHRVRILHAIDEGLDLSGDLNEYNVPHLTLFYRNLIEISREYGEFYTTLIDEREQEMVRLANERDAFAIVSNDTDFLIFDGPWHFWRDLDFNNKTAIEYNKAALRAHLALSQPQMILFATLAGNGYLSQELLSMFHKSLDHRTQNVSNHFRQTPSNYTQDASYYYKKKFEGIAAYVKRIRQLPNAMQAGDILDLARRIFARVDLDQGIEALQHSINFYSLTNMQDEPDSFLRRVSQECCIFIYNVLKKDVVSVSFAFCDLSNTIFPPYFDFFKPIICRLTGVLFAHRENQSFTKTFRVKLDHFQPFVTVDLPAIFPPGEVPPLEDLILTPYEENENLDNIRWDLLCFMISPKLKVDRLRSIPGFNLATYVTLFYLVEENIINIDEADCILIACDGRNLFPSLQTQFSFDEVKRIDGRDARMAFQFLGLMRSISECFSATGLQKYCGLFTFDGLCFHNLRKVWSQLDGNDINSVREELQPYRIYARLSEP